MAGMSAYPPESGSAARRIPLPSPFAMHAGGTLRGAEVAAEVYGTLAPERDNAVLLFTGLSASAHAAAHADDRSPGWWQALIGPGRALDTDRLFVICVNSLGSCFGSTGPRDPDPATGAPYGASFPELRVEDIARAGQGAVEHLGIGQLAAVIGPSLGGMTALAHAVLFPGRARALVSISGSLAASAHAIALRALQREIVGHALHANAAPAQLAQAMKWARKIGVMSYIGADLLENRFGRQQNEPFAGRASGTDFEVESWLEHQAAKFQRTFDPWSYWYLSRAMDLFDFAAHGGTMATAAARLQVERALVVGVREDALFPLAQQRAIAALLRTSGIDTEFVELSSPYGHDAFLVEERQFTPVLGRFLTCGLEAQPVRSNVDAGGAART
jgi:homoserine O-acetyltransferase